MMSYSENHEEGDTFRFNVAVTKPYNADFDGDEMNMHLPKMYWRKRNCGICPPPQPDHFTNEQFAGDRHLSGFSARVV
jgi:hypothetical protein